MLFRSVIFCIHTLGLPLSQTLTVEERVSEICNVQSIGAALENMTLAAAGLGLGSLWICDTYFAQPELCLSLIHISTLLPSVSTTTSAAS